METSGRRKEEINPLLGKDFEITYAFLEDDWNVDKGEYKEEENHFFLFFLFF